MAHRQPSASGEPGGGNHQPHLLYPLNTMQMHIQQQNLYQQQQQHAQQQQLQQHYHQPPQQHQQARHRSPVVPEHQHMGHQGDIPHHRLDPQLRSSPARVTSSNKSAAYPQPEMWRNPIPNTFPHQPTGHPPFAPSQPGDHSISMNREREEEAKRAQEQVMKHFEDSFRFAQQKSSVQTRYQPAQQPAQIPEDVKSRGGQGIGSSRVPSPLNKGHHNMPYAPISQTSPFQELPTGPKKGIPGPPPPLTAEYMRPEIEYDIFYPTIRNMSGNRTRELLSNSVAREVEKYTNNNPGGSSKGSFTSFGAPPPGSRVKVSSPAPQQIYGKPILGGSNSPSSARSYDSETSPLSLTSKGSTRPTPTPPLPSNLPKHEVRSADLANFYMYSSASNGPHYNQPTQTATPRFSPKAEYQTQPLDLGGKRKFEPKRLELEIKKVKNESHPRHFPNQILNLVKGEGGSEKPKTNFPPTSPTETTVNGDEEERNVNPPPVVMIEIKPEVVIELREGFATPPPLPVANVGITPTDTDTHGSNENSPMKGNTPSNSNCGSPSLGIHKGKKVFLQRHSGQDCVPEGSSMELQPTNGTSSVTESPKSPTSNGVEASSDQTTPKSETGSRPRRKTEKARDSWVSNGHDASRKRFPTSSDSEEESKIPRKCPRPKGKRRLVKEKGSASENNSQSESAKESQSDSNSKDQASSQSNSNSSSPVKKRGRKVQPRGDSIPARLNKKSNPFKRPAIHLLKKTGESFLQDGSCAEVAPKLGKCRECRLNGTKAKKHSNIFCRFYAFRKLRYTKNGALAIAGFSDPIHDPSPDDMNLWLPSKESRPNFLELGMAKFLVEQLGDQFCELVQQEKEAVTMSMSQEQIMVAWKRVVHGVREMCDVCDTTLFNFHWACKKCGFVVCIACYRGRKQGIIKRNIEQAKERDEFQWLFCSLRQSHEIENLMLTQAVAGEALTSLGELLHTMRMAWNIPQWCDCDEVKKLKAINSQDSKVKEQNLPDVVLELGVGVDNGEVPVKVVSPSPLAELKQKACSDESENDDEEGQSDLLGILSVPGVRISPDIGLVEAEKKVHASVPIKDEVPVLCEEKGEKCRVELTTPKFNLHKKEKELKHFEVPVLCEEKGEKYVADFTPSKFNLHKKEKELKHFEVPVLCEEKGEKYVADFTPSKFSLQVPVLCEEKGEKYVADFTPSKFSLHKKETELKHFEVPILCEEKGRVDCSPSKLNLQKKEKELKHFVRRTEGSIRRDTGAPSVNSYNLSQTTKLYPGTPHSWLCYGKLLHLHDPLHSGNQKIFQEVWKRGRPVIISHVSDRLNKNLWSPESFAKDFSELKNELINCMTGRLLSSQPMKKFWEGFEHVNKRLKDEKGNPMLLKLKDWPPGEDFAESLPSRFKDLMACLPLSDYTNRSGRLNLASRLPHNFVRPDLGPKMYIAYGSGTHLDKGTTNLHLDISDAVNLMVHVGVPKDVDNKEDYEAVQEAIEQSDVDGATIDRVKEDGELPGALWHIYNSRDADKIRDLLNKVAVERGVRLEAHHDPIHDQSWYLDKALRQRLVEEYNVMGYPIVQFMGDAVFIPAGAPHQVRNLHNCIKIAEDFVSPENVSHCFHLTEEFRNLSETHSNHEDKLQIKNIIYHAVKDAVSVLHHSLSEESPPPEGPPASEERPHVTEQSLVVEKKEEQSPQGI